MMKTTSKSRNLRKKALALTLLVTISSGIVMAMPPLPYEPMPVVPLPPMEAVTMDPAAVAAKDALVKKSEEIRSHMEQRVGSALRSGVPLRTLQGYMDATSANPNVLDAKAPDPCDLNPNLPHCKPFPTSPEICQDLGGTWVNGKCDFGTGDGGDNMIGVKPWTVVSTGAPQGGYVYYIRSDGINLYTQQCTYPGGQPVCHDTGSMPANVGATGQPWGAEFHNPSAYPVFTATKTTIKRDSYSYISGQSEGGGAEYTSVTSATWYW